jgi:hypothetical protein
MKLGEPYKDRILHFARLNYQGINEKGWSEKKRRRTGTLLQGRRSWIEDMEGCRPDL